MTGMISRYMCCTCDGQDCGAVRRAEKDSPPAGYSVENADLARLIRAAIVRPDVLEAR